MDEPDLLVRRGNQLYVTANVDNISECWREHLVILLLIFDWENQLYVTANVLIHRYVINIELLACYYRSRKHGFFFLLC